MVTDVILPRLGGRAMVDTHERWPDVPVLFTSGFTDEVIMREGETRTDFMEKPFSRDMLPALYASADAFLCASTTETLRRVILEAMASGLPVVAVAAGGVADHLRHLVNGIACAVDEHGFAAAIRQLNDDPALRQRLGVSGRAWAVSIRWERELDRLVESYREVSQGAGSRRNARGPYEAGPIAAAVAPLKT